MQTDGKRVAGWILFGFAAAIYAVVTLWFGYSFGTNTPEAGDSGEGLGYVFIVMLFMIVGNIGYAVAFVQSLISVILMNVNRGERRINLFTIVLLVAVAVTWASFYVMLVVRGNAA